jgi:hypothetical protein
MSDSEKTTDRRHLEEVMPLLQAGADLTGIQKHAAEHGWSINREELQRCLRMAHQRPARGAKGAPESFDPESLKGTVVQEVLRALSRRVGLDRFFEPSKPASPANAKGSKANADSSSPLTRRERVVRRLIAEAKDDQVEVRLVEHATPFQLYRWRDTTLPIQLLNILTLDYVAEQLDRAAMVANALFCSAEEPDDTFWDFIGLVNAYAFRIGQEGWQQFAQELGVDADYLVDRNHRGVMLQAYSQKICGIAPSLEEVRTLFAEAGYPVERINTAEDVAQGWRDAFLPILGESSRA